MCSHEATSGHNGRIGLSKVSRPTKHIIGHIGNGFTGQMTQPTVSKHRRRSGWTSGGTHGERRRWVRAELGVIWGGVSPLQPTKGSGGAS